MKPIAKTDFSKMSAGALAAVNEVLEITSVKTVVGFFVPTEQYMEMQAALNHARADEARDVLEEGE